MSQLSANKIQEVQEGLESLSKYQLQTICITRKKQLTACALLTVNKWYCHYYGFNFKTVAVTNT